MHRHWQLPLILLLAGLSITAVHDYAYRRVDNGEGDYELYGLISHAGSDMVIVTGILFFIALGWHWPKR